MSKVDELINKLCPNGVKYKTIGEIATYRRGSFPQPYTNNSYYGGEGAMPFVQVADILDNGFVLKEKTKQTISKIAQPKSIFVPKGSVICSIQGTIGRVAITQYDSYVDRTIAIFDGFKIEIDKRFFAYCIQVKFGIEKQFARGSTLKTITKEEFTRFCIPVPPLEVQREIVHILDDFTLLSAELSAELKAREKQYEYYKNKLLNFGENIPRKSISELCQLSAGGDIDKGNVIKEKNDEFNIPVYSNGIGENALYGFTNSYKIEAPAITISGRGTIGYCELHKENFYPIVRLICAKPKTNDINISFLKYYIDTISFKVPTTGIPQLTVPMISNYLIPVPSLKEQERIVNILDRFDKLCNDILEGLPAEIESRKKQYEYYRDKLLTFKELKVEE